MQRLRTTFTRSRTPTGAEMKTQTSLEVPKQKVRSASFDEMTLEAQRAVLKHHLSSDDPAANATGFLQVPQTYQQQRSHSFDSSAGSDDSGTFLEVPGSSAGACGVSTSGSSNSGSSTGTLGAGAKNRTTFNSFNIGRRASASVAQSKAPPSCWHCYYLEQYERQVSIEQRFFIDHHELKSLSYSDSSSYSSDGDNDDENDSNAGSGNRQRDDSEDEGVVDHNNDIDECSRLSPQFGNTLLPPMSPCNITFTLSPTNGDFPTVFPSIPSPPLVTPCSDFPHIIGSASPPLMFHSSPPPSPLPYSNYLGYSQQLQQQSNQLQSPSIELPIPLLEDNIISTNYGQRTSSSPPIEPPPELQFRPRRRSISRQEAIFVEPTGNSLENVCCEEQNDMNSSCDSSGIRTSIELIDGSIEKFPTLSASTSAASEEQDISIDLSSSISIRISDKPILPILMTENLVENVRDIYLTVPDLKRDRAASVDSCFSKVSSAGKTEELQPGEPGCFLSVPNINATRSRSVDIVLPTDEQARYKALALTGAAGIYGRSTGGGVKRQIRIVPDWSENAINGDHLWVATSASGDLCAVPEECRKSGQRMKCSACQLIAHLNCIPTVNEKTQLQCKPTFRDVGVRQYREQTQTHHHWVHRRQEKSKCKACSRAMQGKLFSSKEVVALSCAWCKQAYHNKESCFNPERIGEECSLGAHKAIVVPPSWIVKLPGKGNFKSSLRSQKKRPQSSKRKSGREPKEQKAFIVKPIPGTNITPVIVFINPKSGGNQGVKLLGKFQWLLNPRQVFDLTQGGPKMGLELFRKAPNLRILACGGDGTVGWVLSILDQINIQPQPAVGVLPLGTGNDLARALGWGGGYTDEPVGKILMNIGKSDSVLLDRWSLKVTPNPDADPSEDGKDNLPLNVVNNYFSFGVDAHIALEFHEAREAHPEKFNSRIRNKMFYGTAGGKDLLQRKWRSLSSFVTLECDGTDYTKKLKDSGVHAILFLNIPSYGGGTHPWNNSAGQQIPATDDGLIEVVGLTTYQLPMLQAGAHGTCICQCKTAKITTSKTIPMQVDGEACRVKPSIIELELLNKALLLAKRRRGRPTVQIPGQESLNLLILRITMPNYEQYHYDKDMLKSTAINLGNIEVEPVADLEQTRNIINKYLEDSSNYPGLSQEWCFVDSCTAERFFRIDRAQEHLHYVTDIASDEIFILDQECATMPQTPDQERSFHQYSQRQEQNENRSRISNQTSGAPSSNNNNATNNNDKSHQFKPSIVKVLKMRSVQERLFNSVEDPKGLSNVLEKTSDAVLLAAKTDDLIMLQILHEQGYSLLSTDSNGQTALHYGSRYNFKDIVRYLISCAPRSIINIVDNINGQTALHLAATNKNRDICVMLVAAGASLNIRDHCGNTPMMIAFNQNAHELAAYLESKIP